MAIEMEGLEFQIQANTAEASKGIDALAASFARLKSALNTKTLTGIAEKLDTISKAVNESGIGKLEGLCNALGKLGAVTISPTIPKRISEISTAVNSLTDDGIGRLERLSTALQGMQNTSIPAIPRAASPRSTSSPRTRSTRQAPRQENTSAQIVAQTAAETEQMVRSSFNLREAANAGLAPFMRGLEGVGLAAKTAASAGIRLGQVVGSHLTGKVKQATSGFTQLFNSIKRIAMYRLIRSMFSALTNGMREGINNLYQYSNMFGGTFAGSLDRCATSFQYLKNSMAAAASPIINALAPALDFIIDKIVMVLNLLNQLFARLTGKSTYTAAKKAAASYADSAGKAGGAAKKAAKEIKDATLGMDELNVISPNDNSGGGGGGGGGAGGADFGSMFEELPIDSAISEFADKLKQAFEAGNWQELGTLIGGKFNEIVDSVDWSGIGTKIGYAVNGAVQTAYYALKTADFQNLGRHIAELINHALEQIEGEFIGRLLVRKITAGLDTLIGLLDGLNWALVGKTVGDAIRGAIDEAYEWIKVIDFSRFGTYFAEGINSALTSVINAEDLGRTISLGFTGLLDVLISFITNLNWGLVGETIGDLIKGAVGQTANWIMNMDWSGLAHSLFTGLINLIKGLDYGGIAASFYQMWGAAMAAQLSFIGTIVKDIIVGIKNYFLKFIRDENGDGKFGGIEIINGLLAGILEGILGIGKWIKDHIFSPFIKGFKAAFGIHSPSKVMKEMGIYVIEGFLQGLMEGWKGVLDFLSGVLDGIKTLIENVWKGIATITQSIWNGIQTVLSGIWNGIKTVAGTVFGAIKDVIGKAWETVKTISSTIWNGIKTTLSGLWEGLKTIAGTVFGAIKDTIGKAWETVKTVSSTIWNNIKSTVSTIWNNLKTTAGTIFNGIKDAISKVWENVKTATTTIWNGLKTTLSTLWNGLKTTASTVFNAMKDTISKVWENVKTVSSTVWNGIKTTVSGIWNGMKTTASSVFNGIQSAISTVWNTVSTTTSSVWNGITSTLNSLWNGLNSTASTVFNAVKDGISTAWTTVTTFTSETWNSITSTLSNTWENIKSTAVRSFENIKTSITNVWDNLKNSALTWGRDICGNIADGIGRGIDRVTSAVKLVANTVKGYLGFSEPDLGPLSNFHTYMPDMLHLMASGIRDNAYLAEKAVHDLADNVSQTLNHAADGMEFPVYNHPAVQYADNGKYNPGSQTEDDITMTVRNANSEVVAALYTVANQLVSTIEALADRPIEVDLDGEKVSSRMEKYQRERGKSIMAGGVL